eukprot:gene18147-9375_t
MLALDKPALALRAASFRAFSGRLRGFAPGSGAYFNEADYYEPEWRDAFWGGNYPRLGRR